VWWTSYPVLAPVLTGWAGGPAGERLAALGPYEVVERALEELGRVLGTGRAGVEADLDAWYWHNWVSDPFARGAYSYVGANGLPCQDALARPVEDTLFFAGEATETTGHFSTVHGALLTGARAAREVRASLE
jgi:monoamine oxidase